MADKSLKLNKNQSEDGEKNEDYIVVGTDYNYKHEIYWPFFLYLIVLHLLSAYAIYLLLSGKTSWTLWGWCEYSLFMASTLVVVSAGCQLSELDFLYHHAGGIGITMGAHRLYSHRSFEAHPALRFILLVLQTSTGQLSMFRWVRDHRLHHRYSDTDVDPHNAKRGFFFSHIGWLMTKRHPLHVEHIRKVDMRDLKADWMVMFQNRYYFSLFLIFGLGLPVWFGVYFFNESYLNVLALTGLRIAYNYNSVFLINSAAHSLGNRPYDKNIQPVETWFGSVMVWGEGWHNYHHSYPWDYKAAELPYFINITTFVIDLCAAVGLVRNRKFVGKDTIEKKIKKSGDGTHEEHGYDEAKEQMTAIGPLHPLNPTYTVTYEPPKISAKIFTINK